MDCEMIQNGSWQPKASGGTAPYRYVWEGTETDVNVLSQHMETGKEYELKIIDSKGCAVIDTLVAPYLGGPLVNLPTSISLLLGSDYQFEPVIHLPESLLAGVRWLPGENLSCGDCLNPVIEVLQEGTYTIRVIDVFGCTDEASAEIILNTDYPIYVPNVFSPNGDEKNDRFGVMSHASVINKVLSLTLYNRWGSQIFQIQDVLPDDVQASWDGTSGGRPAPPGIYLYHVEVELTNGDTKRLMGDVLLIR
jgi:gliding motility-associated-like protein